MRKSKFTDSQIMDAVKRVEAGFAVPDICRELGVSTATFYKWRAKYGGMDVSMMSRMKELEDENRRLKKMYLEEKLKAEIVSEAARILRRGGLVTLTAFSAYFQVRFLEESDTFDAGLGLNHERTVVHDPEGRPLPAELWTSCYTPRELRLLLGNAGLDVEALWSVTPGSYEPNPPDLDHPEFLVLARRR